MHDWSLDFGDASIGKTIRRDLVEQQHHRSSITNHDDEKDKTELNLTPLIGVCARAYEK
jgi:hypothetical protein